MDTAIHIGNTPEDLRVTVDDLIRLMEVKADQETIRAAIAALTKINSVSMVTISGNTFSSLPPGPPPAKDDPYFETENE